MIIKKCKWYNNAQSPVLLMIDDLANVWVDINGNGKIDLGEDWGYAKRSDNSSVNYLENEVLKNYPEVKITFFVPVGVRAPMIKKSFIKHVSASINADRASRDFFQNLHQNPRYELAYHGTTHGKAGEVAADFVQEWKTFKNLHEAINTINTGKEILINTVGVYPKGGKYCGYESNEFSDQSIDKTGFLWWCRYWNRGLTEKNQAAISGNDCNLNSNFDIKEFGSNNVIDIPSTVNGSLLTSLLNANYRSLKGVVKSLLKKPLIRKKLFQIDYLLNNKLVISIQEHISPAMNDGNIQKPNIFTDAESLKVLFGYLKSKNVWYCTGTELAEYVYARSNVNITTLDNHSFEIAGSDKDVSGSMLTIIIEGVKGKKVLMPNNEVVNATGGSIFNLKVMAGVYKII